MLKTIQQGWKLNNHLIHYHGILTHRMETQQVKALKEYQVRFIEISKFPID